MIRERQSPVEEAHEKANALKDRALESIAGGLAQLKHVRTHQKEGVGEKARATLDAHIAVLQEQVEALSGLNLGE